MKISENLQSINFGNDLLMLAEIQMLRGDYVNALDTSTRALFRHQNVPHPHGVVSANEKIGDAREKLGATKFR